MDTKPAAAPSTGDMPALTLEDPVARYMRRAPMTTDREEAKALRLSARADFMRPIGLWFRKTREALDMEIGDVASLMGVHRNTLWNFERGDSSPDLFDLELMARVYKTTSSWLLSGGTSGVKMAADVPRNLRAIQLGHYIYVPEFDVHVSAGNGFFNDIEAVVAMRPFDESYIRNELGIHHNELALTKVIGRSMEPELRSRDTTMVDLKDREVLTEGTHILRLDGALLIKKVQRMPGKVLRVSSCNPDFQSFDVEGREDADRDFEVLGRVRWGGVTFS